MVWGGGRWQGFARFGGGMVGVGGGGGHVLGGWPWWVAIVGWAGGGSIKEASCHKCHNTLYTS